MKVSTLGIDLAKSIFRIHAVDFRGAIVLRRQLTRKQLLPFLARLEPCLVSMEACAGAHYWAREIQKLGHTARLMSPHFVTPYRKSQKNDGNDAEAVCEAVGRPSMRFVPIKSAPQQDIQALHRIRFQLIKWRTALANEIRGLLGEYGIVVAKGIAPLRRGLQLILDDGENQLSGLFREMLGEMAERLKLLDQRIRQYDSKVQHAFGQDERCRRLARVEGVGALVATALVAAVGNAHEFKNGRELSAWLGLVPRQHSSGGRNVLLGISKRGDRYLRTLLIHGARFAVRVVERRKDPCSVAISRLKARRGPNVAAVALKNRNARVLWALLKRGEDYRPRAAQRMDVAQSGRIRRGEKRDDYLPRLRRLFQR
jgi:transposase